MVKSNNWFLLQHYLCSAAVLGCNFPTDQYRFILIPKKKSLKDQRNAFLRPVCYHSLSVKICCCFFRIHGKSCMLATASRFVSTMACLVVLIETPRTTKQQQKKNNSLVDTVVLIFILSQLLSNIYVYTTYMI